MLKLIYKLSDRDITLKYQRRQTIWTKTFALALLIALLFHSLFFVLIKIKKEAPIYHRPFQTPKVSYHFEKYTWAVANPTIDVQGLLTAAPMWREDKSPHMEVEVKPMGFIGPKLRDCEADAKDFVTLERGKELRHVKRLSATKWVEPIQVNVLGEIEKRFSKLHIKKVNYSLGSTKTLSMLFEVFVDDRTGALFNVVLKESSGSLKHDLYAQNLVKNLKFAPKEKSFSSSGLIEIKLIRPLEEEL